MKRALFFILVSCFVTAMQGQTVQGVISSNEGEILVGATVLLKGTTSGTVTDLDGKYQIDLGNTADPVLVFSYTGYTPQEIEVNGRTQIDIELASGLVLQEAVVTGLGISRDRKKLGYATSTISSKDLTTTQVTNFASALYGKAPGVSIRSVPGGATSGVNINIRGFASITGSTQPLIVMDGVPIRNGEFNNTNYWGDQYIRGNGLTDINPEDIESLSVLKGASAAALYGSEAVNGVILITTKKGSRKQGLGIDFSASYNNDQIAYLPRYQNVRGPGYFTNLADAGQDENGFIYYDTNGDGTQDTRGLINTSVNFGPEFDGQPVMSWDGVVRPYVAADNSYADLFQNAQSSSINLAISKGFEKSNFRFSFTRQDNQMISYGSKNERNIANLSANFDIGKSLTTTLTVKYINQFTKNRPHKVDRMINNFGGMMDRFESADWYYDRYKTSLGYMFRTGTQASLTPDENIIYNGFKSAIADYVWRVNEHQIRENNNRIIATLGQTWQIVNGLSLQGRISTDYTSENVESWNSTRFPSALYNNPAGGFSMNSSSDNLLYGDVMLTFENQLTQAVNMKARAGYTAKRLETSYVSRGTAGGLSPENFFDISASINTPGSGSNRSSFVTDGFFGTLEFGYQDYLFVEGTIRRDRTSTMAPDNNSFVYPSVNASLVMDEAFNLPNFVSFAKLRASYGIVGNYPSIYQANIAYNQNTLGVQAIGGRPILYTNISSSFGNDLIKPEQKQEFEFGLDLAFFNRLQADITYYNGKIVDQILPVVIPRSSGARTVLTNIGTLRNKGVEISLSADIVKNNTFKWNSRINYAKNVNSVEKLANDATELLHADFDGNAAQIRSVVGQPMGDIYAHPVATNANGEKIVGPNGLYQLDGNTWEKYGNAMPDFEGGFLNTVSFKNVFLNVVADFSFGGYIMPTGIYWMTSRGLTEESLTAMNTERGGLSYYVDADGKGIQTTGSSGPNGETVFNDGILLEGVLQSGETNTNVVSQATYYNGTYNWGGPQYGNSRYELYIDKNDWVKIREISLGFNVPKNLASKLGMSRASFSVFGRNLFFLYRTIKDLDPEQTTAGSRWYQNINNAGNNPSFRTFGVQLNASF